MLNLGLFIQKKVILPLMFVAMIATANVFLSDYTGSPKSNVISHSLSDVSFINHASAEVDISDITPDSTLTGWQTFWKKVGEAAAAVKDAIINFFTGWQIEFGMEDEWLVIVFYK